MALPSNSWQFSSSLQTRKKSEAVLGDGFFVEFRLLPSSSAVAAVTSV
jgi:hypothetical protein